MRAIPIFRASCIFTLALTLAACGHAPANVSFTIGPQGFSAATNAGYTFKLLHSFTGGYDGGGPHAALIIGQSQEIFGTAQGINPYARGLVFRMTGTGHETLLHRFQGVPDGRYPATTLRIGRDGAFYGTTWAGGKSCTRSGAIGCGVLYRVDAAGNETVLHRFSGNADGANPEGRLVQDSSGAWYGTAPIGGTGCPNSGTSGCGAVFKYASGTVTPLYEFTGGTDGANPQSDLIQDRDGNLYGTAAAGGNGGSPGYGVVFKITPAGKEQVLYAFSGTDGETPIAGLARDPQGNFYGVTENGGQYGWGVVFKLTPDGTETVLHHFTGGADGATPVGTLIRDEQGALYGTAMQGGQGQFFTYGTVFKISASGVFTVLHAFDGKDGVNPSAGLVQDAAGNLYGTTYQGGSGGQGVVFELSKS